MCALLYFGVIVVVVVVGEPHACFTFGTTTTTKHFTAADVVVFKNLFYSLFFIKKNKNKFNFKSRQEIFQFFEVTRKKKPSSNIPFSYTINCTRFNPIRNFTLEY